MRWIVRLIFLVVVLAALAVGALFLIPTDRIAALIGDQFEKATGRSLVISGAIRPSIYPVLGVRAEGIEIGNPGWVIDGPLLSAQRLNIGVEPGALMGGEVRVRRFELVEPQIVLVRAADGAVSWDFSAAGTRAVESVGGETAAPGGGLAAFGVDLAEITGGTLLFRDLAAGTEIRASDLDVSLQLPSAEAMATLEGSARVNGAAIGLNASVEGVGPLLDGRLRPVDLALDWAGGEARFEGRAGISPPSGEGALALEATDLAPLMALAGQPAPVLPKGLGRDRMALSATFTLSSEGTAHLRGTRLALDGNSLAGDIDILPGDERPLVRARLEGGAWDLSSLAGDGTDEAQSPGAGWPRDPIDASGLFAADAEALLTLAGLDLGLMDLGRVDIRAALDRGRLVLDLNELAAYGGAITGQYVVNGRGGLSMRGDLTVSQVDLAPLLTDFAGYDRLQGTGDARLEFLVSGNSVDALMNSLEGRGSVAFGEGAILGLDIGGMIRNLDTSYRGEGAKTVYDSITASFTMDAGVLTNEDLILMAGFGEMTGAGTLGLGQQRVDYTLIPQVIYRRAGGGDADADGADTETGTETETETAARERQLRVPLRIHGPWSSLKYSLDLEAIAQERLGEQIEVLQERAQDAAAEALGITLEEGQTIEEAASEAVQERLQQETRRQLERLLTGGGGEQEAAPAASEEPEAAAEPATDPAAEPVSEPAADPAPEEPAAPPPADAPADPPAEEAAEEEPPADGRNTARRLLRIIEDATRREEPQE